MDVRYGAALAAKRLRRMAGLQAALDSGTGLADPIVVPDAPCPWKRLQGYHVSRGDRAETRGDTQCAHHIWGMGLKTLGFGTKIRNTIKERRCRKASLPFCLTPSEGESVFLSTHFPFFCCVYRKLARLHSQLYRKVHPIDSIGGETSTAIPHSTFETFVYLLLN